MKDKACVSAVQLDCLRSISTKNVDFSSLFIVPYRSCMLVIREAYVVIGKKGSRRAPFQKRHP